MSVLGFLGGVFGGGEREREILDGCRGAMLGLTHF